MIFFFHPTIFKLNKKNGKTLPKTQIVFLLSKKKTLHKLTTNIHLCKKKWPTQITLPPIKKESQPPCHPPLRLVSHDVANLQALRIPGPLCEPLATCPARITPRKCNRATMLTILTGLKLYTHISHQARFYLEIKGSDDFSFLKLSFWGDQSVAFFGSP